MLSGKKRDPERLEERVAALDDKIQRTQRRADKSRLRGRKELEKVRNLDDDFRFISMRIPCIRRSICGA